jgi:hypothetical protein
LDPTQPTTQTELSTEQIVQSVYNFAAQQMRAGVAASEIESQLLNQGLDAEAAAVVVKNLVNARAQAVRKAGQKKMLYGALWCIGGIVVTTWTHQAAMNSGGGHYVVAWGAVVFGAIQFFRGMFQSATGK